MEHRVSIVIGLNGDRSGKKNSPSAITGWETLKDGSLSIRGNTDGVIRDLRKYVYQRVALA